MPKLSKIRLTGCRYDGLKKEHENSIFDLTKNDKADHSLFTLCNGGGKGVMMQLIFQLLLPETKWGKNSGNKVISMFYDQRNNLVPFTFHVALEWILDTVPEKRLITGIAVKAVLKNSVGEDDGKAGLSYFLYTHEHDNKGFYTIENLPLYNEKENIAIDIDILDDFISNNRRDFIKYSQSSVRRKDSDYFSYLETRGIYRSEWTNLRDINKLEGGSGDYFTGASDNKSIFDKIIIPAISQNIKNYSYDEKDNLLEMFRSNLSITKDLPVLIKRENDYRELLTEIKPLIQNAQIGSKLIDHKEGLIDYGNDLFFILSGEKLFVDREIEKWDKEQKNAYIEKVELEYKKDNFLYNQQKRELEFNEKEVDNLEASLKEKSEYMELKREEKLCYQINEKLKYKKNTENDIESKYNEKNKLIESLNLSDIMLKAEELDNEIELEWENTKSVWMDVENQYFAYTNYNKSIKKENEGKIKEYKEKVDALNNEINRFMIKEEDFEKQRRKLEGNHDPMSLLFPEKIKEDILKINSDTSLNIKNLEDKIFSWGTVLSNLKEEKIKSENYIDNIKKTVKELDSKIKKQEKYEREIARGVAKLLLEDSEGGFLEDIWFERKGNQLKALKKEKLSNLESLQKLIWGKNIDILLNKEEYFVPNKDVILIKEEIQKLGVNVQTGSEYLYELVEEEKKDLLKTHPEFLYSLVIGSLKDWDTIEKNISENLFLNNMVPLFVRSEMKKDTNLPYKTISNKADELVESEIYYLWKSNMKSEVESLVQTEKNLKVDIEDIEKFLQAIETLKNIDTVFALNKKINEEKKLLAELQEKIRVIDEELSSLDNNLKTTENELSDYRKKLSANESELILIEAYIEKKVELEIEKINIKEIKKEKLELEKSINSFYEENDAVSESQALIENSYFNWKLDIEKIINSLKEVYKNAEYYYKEFSNYANRNIPKFILEADKIKLLISERRVIDKDIAEKDKAIAVVETKLEGLENELRIYIAELKSLSKDWATYEYMDISLDEIRIVLNEVTKEIDRAVDEKEELKSKIYTKLGSIKEIKKQLSDKESYILKTYKKAPVSLQVEDISIKLDLVERELKSNSSYLNICSETLEKNKDKKIKLEANILKMKSGYPLELDKGKMDLNLKNKVLDNIDFAVDDWQTKCENNNREIDKARDNGEYIRREFVKKVEIKLKEDNLRTKIVSTVKEANISNFKNNYTSFNSMEEHFQKEILSLTNDKSKAQEVMKQWSERASMHVIKMIEGLKNMVSSMNYINEQGYAFPLVKLKGIDRLPKEKSEIIGLLEEYFLQSISKILDKYKDISSIDDKELKDIMGDKIIFSKALQGRYPTLMVYKMSEKNEFRYARAREEYYTTWEAINKGEGDQPEGSGGQTLSVNTFVIMMIMSFKKKYIGNENPSTVLILDNPFGKASAKHVLDPIFEIADKLNFQLLCFAAPEIIKVEISERFPIFWELKIDNGKIVHGGRILKQ